MYTYTVGLPLLTLAAVIDASVLSYARFENGQPSLLILVLVAWGLLNDLEDAIPWAIIGGIVADLLSVAPLGASSLGFVLMVSVNQFAFGRITRRNLLIPPLAAVLGTLVYQAVMMGILIVFGWSVPIVQAIPQWIIPSMVFNFLLVLFVFRTMGRIVEFFRPPQQNIFG